MDRLKWLIFVPFPILLFAASASAQQTGWTYLQDSVGVFCSSFQTSNSCSLGPGNILPTTAGSIRIVEVQSDVVSLIQSVCDGSGCAGTNDGWQHCANCTSNAIALGGHYVDVWYTQGTSGTFNNTAANVQNVVVKRSTANSPTIFGVNFYEILPPPGSFGSFDTASNNPVSTCTACTSVGLTLSATDFVLENADSGAPAAWNAWSAPFITDWNANGIGLNIPPGTMTAPTVTYCTTACNRSATGHNLYAIAFKSSLGTFTPTPHTYSVINFAPNGAGGLNCSVSCTVSIGGTTRAGDLLYIASFPNSLVSVSGASSGSGAGAWVVPASCVQNATIASIGGSLSCAYVLSSNAGATTLTVKTNSSRASSFAVWEIGAPAGYTFTLDAIGAALNTGGTGTGGFQFLGEPLTITSNDVIFQNSWDPGGSLGPSLYAQPGIPCSFPCTNGNNASGPGNYFQLNEAESTVLLDSAPIQGALGLSTSTAPNAIWMNAVANQNTVVSGTAFTATPPTITAAGCDSGSVQNALNAVAVDGTIVVIPSSCSATWTSTVTYNQVFSTTIQGGSTTSGTCAPAGACSASDSTMITDAFTGRPNGCGAGDGPVLVLNTAANKSLRLTGITWLFSGNGTCLGTIQLAGGSHATRIDHNHFNGGNFTVIGTYGDTWGVVDHNLFNLNAGTWNAIKFQATTWNGEGFPNAGDFSWNDATTFGSNRFIYVENNFFLLATTNTGAGYADDCIQGGRFVWRYNLLQNAQLQTHPTGGSGRHRGCRAMEIYGNQFVSTGGVGGNFIGFFYSAGSGLIWGNTQDSGYSHFVSMLSMRRLGTASGGTYNQGATPGGWGYCGTSFNGTGSNWDQNTNTATGYRCLDQPGTGKSDLLTGGFASDGSGSNNVVNATTGCNPTQTCAFPRQQLEPVYEWLNTSAAQFFWLTSIISPNAFIGNQDYYNYTASFNGTSGTGSGTLAARPATCTPNPDPLGVGGVAYWATDQGNWNQSGSGGQGRLYVCTATNTWTTYYVPLTYPHPLTASTTGTPAIVSLNPASVNFGSQTVSTASAAQTVTLTNIGGASITIGSISLTGTNAADFSISSNTCGTSLASGGSCTVSVRFTPTAIASRSANLTFVTNASTSPDNTALSGSGIPAGNPAANFSPTSASFGQIKILLSSSPSVITLTNAGTAAMSISSISISGTNANEFSQNNNCPASLGAGLSCTINVTFSPISAGNKTANVSVASNTPTSPDSALLSGIGTAPIASLSAANVNFFNQSLSTTTSLSQTIILLNAGTASMNIASVSLGGTNPGDFSIATACGSILSAGNNCSITLTFTPASLGSRNAILSIADDAAGSPHAAVVSGTGIKVIGGIGSITGTGTIKIAP